MSRAITVQDFKNMWNKVNGMRKVPFPKIDEVTPLTGVSQASDYPIGNPTLDMMAGIESISPLPFKIYDGVENFMPVEFPSQPPKEYTSKRPAMALPYNKVPESVVLNHLPSQKEPAGENLDKRGLENLLAAFKESGMNVKEVKLLPSGATRITFDEFFGTVRTGSGNS